MHVDAMRIIEFYCNMHNVEYCQGMLEVLLPFLFMKSQEEKTNTDADDLDNSMMQDPMNMTMAGDDPYCTSKNT